MKLLFWLPIFFLFVISCSNSPQNNTEASMGSERGVKVNQDSMHANSLNQNVFFFSHILKYYETSKEVTPHKNCSKDINSLTYNKVIAYDFYGEHEQFPVFRNSKFDAMNYNNNVYNQKSLNQNQVNFITTHLSKSSSYGGLTAACFDPSMALIFFNHDTIVMELDICLDCNYYEIISKSDIGIDVELEVYEKFYDDEYDDTIVLYKYGFSDSGVYGIANLAKELNLKYQNFIPTIKNNE